MNKTIATIITNKETPRYSHTPIQPTQFVNLSEGTYYSKYDYILHLCCLRILQTKTTQTHSVRTKDTAKNLLIIWLVGSPFNYSSHPHHTPEYMHTYIYFMKKYVYTLNHSPVFVRCHENTVQILVGTDTYSKTCSRLPQDCIGIECVFVQLQIKTYIQYERVILFCFN